MLGDLHVHGFLNVRTFFGGQPLGITCPSSHPKLSSTDLRWLSCRVPRRIMLHFAYNRAPHTHRHLFVCQVTQWIENPSWS
jgi:hypothetical protein